MGWNNALEKGTSSNESLRSDSMPRAEIETQLGLILASSQFAKSERMCRFLRFVVEHSIQGSAENLKEYSIGVEVFDKDPSFDPRTDNNVRTEARRLRTKLAEYYAASGCSDAVRIEIPVGSYAPVFQSQKTAVPEPVCEEEAMPPTPSERRWRWLPIVAGALLLIAAAGTLWHFTQSRRVSKPSSIAVLPFLNLSEEEGSEYFADGLTEEILNHLAKVPGLKVVARTSSFQFKGHNEDVRSIGKRLNVEAVLEGSVRRIGKRLRITPQLIATADGFHLWSETVERDGDDWFGLQDEISRLVVKALGAIPVAAATSRTPNPEAYRAVLRARHHFNKFTVQDFKSSLAYSEQAIALDPQYAAAYVRVAGAHGIMAAWGAEPYDEAGPKAMAALKKALDLDPNLAEAYHVRGCIKAISRDWKGAEKDFLQAQSLPSGHEADLNDYAMLFLVPQNRLDEALTQARRALERDPLSPRTNEDLADVLYFRRDYTAAIAQYRQTLDLFPDSRVAANHLFQCFLMNRMFDDARKTAEGPAKSKYPAVLMLQEGRIDARSGNKSEAGKLLSQLVERCSRRCAVTPVQLATLQIEVGDFDGAFRSLDRGTEGQSNQLAMLRVDPVYDPLRSDPRFQALLVKTRLAR